MYTTILFDMDNTLLQSKIDLKGMRQALISRLKELDLCTEEVWERLSTPAQVLAYAKSSLDIPEEVEKELWTIVAEYERLGMQDIALEEGVVEGLETLRQEQFRLAVVTNNAYETACLALGETNIVTYFELIVGREQMGELKPAPAGIRYVLEQLDCAPQQAVMIGDSWIDGRAAQRAQVDFIAYKANKELLAERKVEPVLWVNHFDDLIDWLTKR